MIARLLRRRGALALAAIGGTAAILGTDRSAPVSISTPLLELLSEKWMLFLDELPVPFSPLPSVLGLPAVSFSVASSLPSSGLTNGASGGDGDAAKCCPGCLDRNAIATAAATVSPSVVNISHISATRSYYGMMLGKSMGCGTIIDPNGTILTCAHVVVDRNSPQTVSKRKVDVALQDGRQFEGTVINADFHSDIAIVKIKPKTPLPAAKLGSSHKLRPGEWVVAVGCPLSLQNTVTAGIVSCVDRKSSDLGLGGVRREYLQTDCAINEALSKAKSRGIFKASFKGNSGGPLVNLDGEVIGVNIMKIADADGLSFAVPIDSVVKIVEHFKKNGRVVRPWLGLKMLDLNETIIQHLRERDSSFPNVRKGVLVPMVTPGSPAEYAGFHPGDVVIEFDGRPVQRVQEIIDSMGDQIGVPLKVRVKRANDTAVTLTVVPVEARPEM